MAKLNEKHLEFVQGIISRLANNSFLIKGWSITILTGLLAVYIATSSEYFILLSLIPILIFWLLDSYYLWQERLFRDLYDEIVSGEHPSDFSINFDNVNVKTQKYFSVLFSKTIFPLYASISILVIASYLIICYA